MYGSDGPGGDSGVPGGGSGGPGGHWASSGTHSSGPYSAVADYSAWFISNFQKTVNRLVLAALMSYRPGAKKILYKSTVPERLEWVPGL